MIQVYGTGIVSLFGIILSICGIILSVYMDWTVWCHILTIGIIAGTGLGILFICQVVVVTYWFDRKIALATGIAECGSGFGLAIFSLVINKLMQAYGWRGTQIILAGFISLCFAFSSLQSAPTVRIWRSYSQIFSTRRFNTAIKETLNFNLLCNNYRFTMFVISNFLLNFVFFTPLVIVTDRIKKMGLGDNTDAARYGQKVC